MNNVIGVFTSPSTADQVVSDLTGSGFSSSAVTRFEGGSSDLEARLTSAGVEADEASEYARSVSSGEPEPAAHSDAERAEEDHGAEAYGQQESEHECGTGAGAGALAGRKSSR